MKVKQPEFPNKLDLGCVCACACVCERERETQNVVPTFGPKQQKDGLGINRRSEIGGPAGWRGLAISSVHQCHAKGVY